MRWRRISRLAPDEIGHSHHGTPLTYDPRWRVKRFVNGLGSVMTAVVMMVFVVTKFVDGAWLVVLLIPTVVYLFHAIYRHYGQVAQQLSLNELPFRTHRSPVRTFVLVDNVHAGDANGS